MYEQTSGFDLPTVLAALADRGRLELVRTLDLVGEQCCGRVGELAGLSVGKSTLSHHFKVLRESGITRARAEGTHRYVSLRRAELDAAFPSLLDAVLNAERPAASVSTVVASAEDSNIGHSTIGHSTIGHSNIGRPAAA